MLGRFILQLADIRDMPSGGADGITLSIEPEHAVHTEPTLHAKPPLPGRYGELEIQAFIVSEHDPVENRWIELRRPALPLDLSKVLDAGDVAILARGPQ